MIAFYYALSGVSCAVYYRHEITKSAKNFLLIGVGPVLGALLLGYLFVEATRSLADRRRPFESVDPEVAAGRVAVTETAGLEP